MFLALEACQSCATEWESICRKYWKYQYIEDFRLELFK